MGYTHSWVRPRELDPDRFAAAVQDCRRICGSSGIKLRGIEGAVEPIFAPYIVAFDGGCEWFVVQCICDARSSERPSLTRPGLHFGVCKTEHLAYDLCVQACLIAFTHHVGTDFKVESDGDSSAWDAARELCRQAVGYGSAFFLANQQ